MKIIEYLRRHKISIYHLSKTSGVPQSTLSDLVNGKSDFLDCSGRTLLAISKALNISVENLVKLEPLPYCPNYEIDLPDFLKESIAKVKKANRRSLLFDCYLDELNSSINVSEVEKIISHEQANYLRNRYL